MSKAVAKPQLRGLGKRNWAIGLAASVVVSCSFALWFRVNVLEKRKQHYKDFYENYDDDAAFATMQKAGVYKGFEAQNMWAIPQQAKLKYTQLFNLHDRSRSGFLSGLQCRDILLQSGLPRNILAEIWNLSDIDGDGQLTREEFILAMHLTNHVRSGQPLPSELPADLVPPSYRRTRSISATSVHSANSSQAGSANEDQLSEKSADSTAPTGSVLNSQTFEDKRRENFEKGRAELERRRLKMIEQQTSTLNEQLSACKKQVAEAKAKIDKMRSERDTKAGLITSLEAQLQTVRERKAYLDHEEISLIAIAKDLNLVNSPDAIDIDAEATKIKEENIKQMKEKLDEMQRESATKAKLLAESTTTFDQIKDELKQVSDEVSKTYENYKEKVSKAKVMRQQFVEENKSKTIDLDSIWDSAPSFSPQNKTPEPAVKQSELSAFEPETADPWTTTVNTTTPSNTNTSTSYFSNSNSKPTKSPNDTFSPFEASPLTDHNFGSTRDYSALADSTSKSANESMGGGQAYSFNADNDVGKQLPTEPSAGKRKYRALYAFEARNPDELTMNPGDIIIGSEVVCEPGWLSGETNGKSGLFPEAYVEPLPADDIDDIVTSTAKINLKSTSAVASASATTAVNSSPVEPRYKVLYEFEARNVDELTMKPGDIIIGVEGPHEPGWLMGNLNGQKGLFPEAYVEKLAEVEQAEQTTEQTTTGKSRAKKAEVATVIANYRALGQEQLNLDKGQLVLIRRKMDSGWWEGELQIKGPKELDHLVDELISSELDFVNDLRLCYKVYIEPLSSAMDTNDNQIFKNWHQLIRMHGIPLKKLSTSVRPIDYKFILRSFQNMLDSIVDLYIQFCSNQRESTRQLEGKIVSDIRFKQLVNESQRNLKKLIEQQANNIGIHGNTGSPTIDNHDNGNLNIDSAQCSRAIRNSNLPLASFLIKPMQRITKYSLLFERMLSVIDRTATAPKELREQVLQLKQSSQLLCQQVNEACRVKEDEETMRTRLHWCQSHIKQVLSTGQNSMTSSLPLASIISGDPKLSTDSSFSSQDSPLNSISPNHTSTLDETIIFDSSTRCMGPRRLIKAGSLVKFKSSARELVAFLFNDILLLTQVKNNSLRVDDLFKSDQAQQAYYKLYTHPILLENLFVQDHVHFDSDEIIGNSLLCSPIGGIGNSSSSIGDLNSSTYEPLIVSFTNQIGGKKHNFIALSPAEKTNWVRELTLWSERAREAHANHLTQKWPSLKRRLSINDCLGRLFVTVLEFGRKINSTKQQQQTNNPSPNNQYRTSPIASSVSNDNLSHFQARERWQRMSFGSSSSGVQNACLTMQLFRYRHLGDSQNPELAPLSDIFKTKPFPWSTSGPCEPFKWDKLVKFDDNSTQFMIANKLVEFDEADYLHIELWEDSRFKETQLIARKRLGIAQLLGLNRINGSTGSPNGMNSPSFSNRPFNRSSSRLSIGHLQPNRPTELTVRLNSVAHASALPVGSRISSPTSNTSLSSSQQQQCPSLHYKFNVKLRLHFQLFCDNSPI